MQITLTSKEMDEAVHLWLSNQGFTSDRFSISTRTIAGRTDSGIGSRVEVTLEPTQPAHVFKAIGLENTAPEFPAPRRFGQGHADE